MRISARVLIAVLLMTDVIAAAQQGSARVLLAEAHHVGYVPFLDVRVPPDYESWNATAVIEIDNPSMIGNAPVSDFRLIYSGKEIKASRIVLIEAFHQGACGRAPDANDDNCWLRSNEVWLWDGHLPVGKTRLRMRVSFHDRDLPLERASLVQEFQVKVGRWTVKGRIRMQLNS